jgi:hypothetical protein
MTAREAFDNLDVDDLRRVHEILKLASGKASFPFVTPGDTDHQTAHGFYPHQITEAQAIGDLERPAIGEARRRRPAAPGDERRSRSARGRHSSQPIAGGSK